MTTSTDVDSSQNTREKSQVNHYPTAIRFLRKLRGGSQAHLVQADDGHYYAAKCPDNPQTQRVLVNEYLGGKVFERLNIATAKMLPIRVPQSLLDMHADFHLLSHKERVFMRAGIYLGSRYEVNPEKIAIYDILPGGMMSRIVNTDDFLGAFVADQWLSNYDLRQFVYFRDQKVAPSLARGFVALSIDHGMCLGGPSWHPIDSPLAGIYFDQSVYRNVDFICQIDPWVERINAIEEHHFQSWIDEVPPNWLVGDTLALNNLIVKLIRRKQRILTLIEAAIRANPKCFQTLSRRLSDKAIPLSFQRNSISA